MTIETVILCTGINGLGAVRSLALAGISAAAVYHDARNPVRYSRVPVAKHYLPEPFTAERLLTLLEPYGASGCVLIPCSDRAADFMSAHCDRLRACGLRLAIPPGEVTEALNDKAREIALIGAQGIPMPKSLTALPATVAELLAQLPLPIIVKPRSYAYAGLIRTKNLILESPTEVTQLLHAQREHLGGFVAQEVIPGPDEALWVCNCCFDDASDLRAAFTFQRIRTSPAHFGVTSFAVSRDNARIKSACQAIGRALGYRGPAMIEFKYHEGRDEYCYIETNPRLGMCNIFDTRCGVNNVLATYRLARAEPLPDDGLRQQDGRYFLSVYADLYARLLDREPVLKILASYRACLRAPMAWAFFDMRDPLPFLASLRDTVEWFVGAVWRALRRRLG